MESVIFPHAFLDLPGVCDLPAEHKLVLVAVAVNPRTSACGVLSASPYVVAQLPLRPDVFWGVVEDLGRRQLLVADAASTELFLVQSFLWHRAPAPEEDSSWARQVSAAVARVRSPRVADAVRAALFHPPTARLTALKIPANLLTAMLPRGRGKGWAASEMLTHFATATHPDQTPAGVCLPVLPALASFCSLPLPTVLECFDSLSAAGMLHFCEDTGEIFVPARLRAASERDAGKIQRAAEGVQSWSIFRALAEAVKRRFPKMVLKTTCCPLGEVRGGEVKRGELRDDEAAALFKLRHGRFKAAG